MKTQLIYTAQDGKTFDLFNNDVFDLTNVDGLTVANTSIATTTTPQIDGDELQNIQANPRPVVLDLQIKSGLDVERAKREILNVIKIKQTGTLTLIQGEGNERREMEISGVVQNVSMPRFTNAVIMQVSIYCNNSFWQDVAAVVFEISNAIPKHHFAVYFPKNNPVVLGVVNKSLQQSFNNDGDVDSGMEITFLFTGNATNPKLYNQRGEFIGVDGSFVANDKIIISTYKGKKTITKNGESIIGKITAGSVFLRMFTGLNVFTMSADSGRENMLFYISFKRLFI